MKIAMGTKTDGDSLLTLQRLLGLAQVPALGLQLPVAGAELGDLLLQLEDAALQPLLLQPAQISPATLPKSSSRGGRHAHPHIPSTHLSPAAS